MAAVIETRAGDSHLTHRRFVQVAPLRFSQAGRAERLGFLNQLSDRHDVRLNSVGRGVKGIRLGLAKRVEPVDQVVGTKFGGDASASREDSAVSLALRLLTDSVSNRAQIRAMRAEKMSGMPAI